MVLRRLAVIALVAVSFLVQSPQTASAATAGSGWAVSDFATGFASACYAGGAGGGVDGPIGVTSDAYGNVLISDAPDGYIYRFPATGVPVAGWVWYTAPSTGKAFVVGDQSARPGSTVTFWSYQWAKLNSLSGGTAPLWFWGFADKASSPPACGRGWSGTPRLIGVLPASLPQYMAVIVTSSVGNPFPATTGPTTHVAVVKTNPGYGPHPAHQGTGTVVGVLC